MNPELLLAHFDRISDAPDAIARLRRFILDLAVRGKLVEQNLDDEPASELLSHVQVEKSRLLKEGQIKKLEVFDSVGANEIPFPIPPRWEAIRMGWLARKLGAGSTPLGGKAVYQKDGVPFLRSQNVHDSGLRLDDVAHITRATHDQMSGTHIQQKDILLNITGASIGRCALVPDTLVEGNVSQHVAIIRLFFPNIREFIHLSLISPFFQKVIDDVQVGVSREGLSMQRLRLFPMLLPPLAEQLHIVARVNELMALCDRLEVARNEQESRRDRLTAASLHHLNNCANADAFHTHARFYLDHLPRLTTRSEHLQQFRQTILNLAVRGQLVPQHPRDEPASELLKRIQAEKARLVEEGKIKKDKPLPEISEVEKLFVLPTGWEWVRMQEAFDVRDGTHDTPKYVAQDGVPLITSRNFVDGQISFADAKLISWIDHNSIKKRSGVNRGDILYSMIGGNIGNQVLVDTDREFSIKNVALFKYYTKKESLPAYLNLFLKTVTIGLQNKAVGGAQPFVSLSLLRNIPLPVPPIAEQHRIVAKVDELMNLCDQLEKQLIEVDAKSSGLLEAVLHQALNETFESASRTDAIAPDPDLLPARAHSHR